MVRAARGPLADDRVRQHALSLDQFPSLREALETRRARAFTEEDHATATATRSTACWICPPGTRAWWCRCARASDRYGVLTLDRTVCETYPQPVVNLVEVYGQLLATALQGAEQTRRPSSGCTARTTSTPSCSEAQLGG